MFRHKKTPPENIENEKQEAEKDPSVDLKPEITKPKEESLEDLVRKNLKWSQIIYEQNRKINNKLLWSAVASWIHVLIIVIPLILALLYLPPLLKNVWSQYSNLLGGENSTSSQSTVDSFLKMLNLDPAKQEQLKALLK